MKNLFLAILSSLMVIATITMWGGGDTNGLNFDSSNLNQNHSLIKPLLLAIFLIAGILFGHLYRILSEQDKNGSINISVLKRSFINVTLWKSFLSSPIVFGCVYIIAKEQPDLVISSVLAFENGFICNVVLEKRLSEMQK